MRIVPADRQRNVLARRSFEKEVAGIAFESDILDGRFDRGTIRARTKPQRFWPNEQNGLVAGLQFLRDCGRAICRNEVSTTAQSRRPVHPSVERVVLADE